MVSEALPEGAMISSPKISSTAKSTSEAAADDPARVAGAPPAASRAGPAVLTS